MPATLKSARKLFPVDTNVTLNVFATGSMHETTGTVVGHTADGQVKINAGTYGQQWRSVDKIKVA